METVKEVLYSGAGSLRIHILQARALYCFLFNAPLPLSVKLHSGGAILAQYLRGI